NHKDETKFNNVVSNLEWCTYKYNSNYGTCIQRRKENTDYYSEKRINACKANGYKRGKKDKQNDKNGNVICIYPSAMEAQRKTKVGNQHIIESCQKKRKYAGGYYWEYAEGCD
ncbi:MAG: hypothetical protein IKG03_06145, partial [Clostridiales bacterium]|nr:hypothetical protein [Clostridiales bacterium]